MFPDKPLHFFVPAAVFVLVKHSCHTAAKFRHDLSFYRSLHAALPAFKHITRRMLMIYIAGSRCNDISADPAPEPGHFIRKMFRILVHKTILHIYNQKKDVAHILSSKITVLLKQYFQHGMDLPEILFSKFSFVHVQIIN